MTIVTFLFSLTLSFLPQADSINQKHTLIQNVSIVDVINNDIKEGKNILIVADSIQSITDFQDGISHPDYKVIDMTGNFILPGLFDMHVHLATDPSGGDKIELAQKRLAKYLDHGVTGVRDMAGDTRQLAYLARQASLDEIQSPDIYFSALMAGPTFFADPRTVASANGLRPGNTAWMKAITDETDIKLAVAEAKGTGASGIKLYADLPAHLCAAIIQEARNQAFKVWAHASVIPTLPQDLADAGINSLSHSPLLAWQVAEEKAKKGTERYNEFALDVEDIRFQKLIESLQKKNIYLDPTLHIFDSRVNLKENGIKATQAAYNKGVKLVLGTDKGLSLSESDEFPLYLEMEYWVNEVGIEPIDAIKAATIHSTDLLGISEKLGSIEVGKKATFIALSENPLIKIEHMRSLFRVYKNGIKVR